MKETIKQALTLGFGLSNLTQEKVNKFIEKIMKRQGIKKNEAEKLAKKMIIKSKDVQHKINNILVDSVGSLFREIGLATKKDLEDLKKEFKKRK